MGSLSILDRLLPVLDPKGTNARAVRSISYLPLSHIAAQVSSVFLITAKYKLLIPRVVGMKIEHENTFFYIPYFLYLFEVNNRNTGKRCEICSKLTTKTAE